MPPISRLQGPGLREKLARDSTMLLAIVGVTAVAVVGGVEYVLSTRDQQVLEERIQETLTIRGEGLVSSHAGVFRSLVRDTALTEMQRTIGNAVSPQDVVYGLYEDSTGKPWAYCSPSKQCEAHAESPSLFLIDRSLVRRELSLSETPGETPGKAPEPSTRHISAFGENVIEFSHPVVLDDEWAGTLRYGLSTRSLDQTLEMTRARHRSIVLTSLVTILAVIGLSLVLAITLARRMARRITQPVFDLMNASKRLAAGDHNVRVEIHSRDELQLLGSAFNTMADDLRESYSRLEEKNKALEREIEERKQAEAERGELRDHLNQAQKMDAFGQLAGGVAHDFNNILAVVLGNTELIQLALEDKAIEEVNELNQQIAEAAEQGANLTRQLLTFARREAIHPRLIDVNRTVEDFDKLIRRVLEENVDILVTTDSAPATVLIDPGRLEQVLMNLCVNARDAMPTGGTLSISTRLVHLKRESNFSSGTAAPGHYVVVETKDTGQGMKPEILSRIFEPFFTTKPAGRGTGLGLATVHGIVRDAGGVIDVESEEGKGTTFRVYLPSQEGAAASGEKLRPYLRKSGGASVLLCEDEDTVRSMMLRILQHAGYEVRGVTSGIEALAELEGRDFDLLITDAVMPEMDGGQLSQIVRERKPNLPVLFVSGYTGGVLSRGGVEEDSTHFLRKPFRATDLLERVEAILTKRATQPALVSS